jgi:hypothetical protein
MGAAPKFRFPKGVVNRPTMDWYADQAAAGVVSVLASSAVFSCAALYNNAPQGSYLYCYAIGESDSHTSGMIWGAYNGQPLSTQGNVQQLKFDQPAIPGELWGGTLADPGLLLEETFLGAAIGTFSWPYSWPVAIIPVGWSLLAFTIAPDSTAYFDFTWVALAGE